MWLMMYCCYLLRISFDFDSNSSYSCYFVPFGIVCFCSAVLDSVRDCNVENCSVFYITKHVCLGWRNIRDGVSSGLRRCQDLCLRTVILIALWVAGESMLFQVSIIYAFSGDKQHVLLTVLVRRTASLHTKPRLLFVVIYYTRKHTQNFYGLLSRLPIKLFTY